MNENRRRTNKILKSELNGRCATITVDSTVMPDGKSGYYLAGDILEAESSGELINVLVVKSDGVHQVLTIERTVGGVFAEDHVAADQKVKHVGSTYGVYRKYFDQ